MSFTSDKLRALVRKWQTLIEAHVDVKTTDGYLIRLFAIGFTRRRQAQVRKTTYAQTSQVREIRKKMFEIMTREATNCDLKELVLKFVPEAIGREIEKATRAIYPLQNVYIHKAKILKAPKFDLSKLLELHGESTDVSPPYVRHYGTRYTHGLYRRQGRVWSRISRSRRSSIRCKTSLSDYLLPLYLHDLIPTIYATVVHCMKHECIICRTYWNEAHTVLLQRWENIMSTPGAKRQTFKRSGCGPRPASVVLCDTIHNGVGYTMYSGPLGIRISSDTLLMHASPSSVGSSTWIVSYGSGSLRTGARLGGTYKTCFLLQKLSFWQGTLE